MVAVGRFQGTTGLGRRPCAVRHEVIDLIAAAGGEHVRVFGSVVSGEDSEGSDIDLLFTMTRPLGLMELEALQARVSDLVGSPVDLVPEEALLPRVAGKVLGEAVPL